MSIAGKFDRRIMLQKRELTKDRTGTKVENWKDFLPVWARVIEVRGSERIISNNDTVINNIKFHIRYRVIDPADYRVVYKGTIYNITAATEIGARQSFIQLEVESNSLTK